MSYLSLHTFVQLGIVPEINIEIQKEGPFSIVRPNTERRIDIQDLSRIQLKIWRRRDREAHLYLLMAVF